MKLRFTLPGKSIPTDAMRDFAEKYIDQITDAMGDYETLRSLSVVVKVRNNGQVKLELTAVSEKNTYRRELVGEDYYDVLPRATNEIEDAIYRHRDVLSSKRKKIGRHKKANLIEETRKVYEPEKEEDKEPLINTKKIDYTFMSIDAAIAELEKVGYDFFLFGDEITGNPRVIYHRQDGGYGILEA